jgi:hypothetical protein
MSKDLIAPFFKSTSFTSDSLVLDSQPTVGISSIKLEAEYRQWKSLYQVQALEVQNFLQGQAAAIVQNLLADKIGFNFQLPGQVKLLEEEMPLLVPAAKRNQTSSGWFWWIARKDSLSALHQRLFKLENSSDRQVAAGAGLIRHTTALYMLQRLKPRIKKIKNVLLEERFQLQESNPILTLQETEVLVADLQGMLGELNKAARLAPFIIANPTYPTRQTELTDILSQQGRALARCQNAEMVQTIRERAARHDLNRGLSLSLPYYDDRTLRLKTYDFVVIPVARIPFMAEFVVRAAEREKTQVWQDPSLSQSTRVHLVKELEYLRKSFNTPRQLAKGK